MLIFKLETEEKFGKSQNCKVLWNTLPGPGCLLGQQFVEQILGFLLLAEVVLGALSDEVLEVVGVLLHPQHHALQHQPHRVDADSRCSYSGLEILLYTARVTV